jgi:hypothetical protein
MKAWEFPFLDATIGMHPIRRAARSPIIDRRRIRVNAIERGEEAIDASGAFLHS